MQTIKPIGKMSLNFSVNPEEIKDSGNALMLKVPYLGKAKPGVFTSNREVGRGETKYETLDMPFVLLEEGHEKELYMHREFDPYTQDKATNMAKRIIHILACFVSGDKEQAKKDLAAHFNRATSWAGNEETSYLNLFDKVVRSSKVNLTKEVRIKVTGSVYEGKPSLRFPNYLPFIEDERSENPLGFSRGEDSRNREFLAVSNSLPSAPKAMFGGEKEVSDEDVF